MKSDSDLISDLPVYHSNTASKLHVISTSQQKENVQIQISIQVVCALRHI